MCNPNSSRHDEIIGLFVFMLHNKSLFIQLNFKLAATTTIRHWYCNSRSAIKIQVLTLKSIIEKSVHMMRGEKTATAAAKHRLENEIKSNIKSYSCEQK